MKKLHSIQEVDSSDIHSDNVCLVPTMGALHAGHLSLVKKAKKLADKVAVSIFVNPLQFGEGEDLAKYPRPIEKDLALLEAEGVDYVFLPEATELTAKTRTTVSVAEVTELWEGQHRPGHFEGVATIVTILFNIIRPNSAVFGLKDLQQCCVIRNFVQDLKLPIHLHFGEIIREDSGLALSSRNNYFSDKEREKAAFLNQSLCNLRELINDQPEKYSEHLITVKNELENADFKVEYLAMVDPYSMQELSLSHQDSRLIVAVHFCGVRLIDNIEI